ncbi:MAG: LapA family protein [Anaerolineae bacterium]|nr:MAG: LapA family protein [Anaerolineae bacterium]
MPISILLALLIALVAVVFALQNATTVTIAFLAWQFQGSLALLLLLTLAVGFVVGWLAATPSLIRSRLEKGALRKQIASLEEHLEEERARLAVLKEQIEKAPAEQTPGEKEAPSTAQVS